MKSTEIKFTAIPSTEEVKAERDRLAYRSRYGRVLRSTIYALVVVAAVAVLLAPRFGLVGVWFAMCAELCTRGALFLLRLARGKWLDKGALA